MASKQQQHQQQQQPRLLKEIHPSLQCLLCYGYLIDAATITECLHSFCKSCILVYLRKKSRSCPVCGFCLSVTNPQIRLDKILQDIVYKVVPSLYRNEMTKRTKFYNDSDNESNVSSQWSSDSEASDSDVDLLDPNDDKDDGISSLSSSSSFSSTLSSRSYFFDRNKSKHHFQTKNVKFNSNSLPNRKLQEKKRILSEIPERIVFDANDSISLELCYRPGQVQFAPVSNIYLCCPALFRIELMKKFCQNKFNLPTDIFEIEIFYEGLPLLDTFTLMDIAYISNWKQTAPLRLYFTLYPLKSKTESKTKPQAKTREVRARSRTQTRSRTPKTATKSKTMSFESEQKSFETLTKKFKKSKTDVPIKSQPIPDVNIKPENQQVAIVVDKNLQELKPQPQSQPQQIKDPLQNKDDEMKKLFLKAIDLISRV